MKSIARWDHLSEYGIVFLTGESCGLGYRVLCDVTAKGKNVLEKCFGIPNLNLPASWNGGSAQDPHVGSILLAPDCLIPLAVFALLENGCKEVWLVQNQGVHGIQAGDPADTALSLQKWLGTTNLRRLSYGGTARDRNVHLMSGRVS
jgi:hypothetical protein